MNDATQSSSDSMTIIMKQGEKLYLSVEMLEYDMSEACNEEQRLGVQAVMDMFNQATPQSDCEVVVMRRLDVPKPLNTKRL